LVAALKICSFERIDIHSSRQAAVIRTLQTRYTLVLSCILNQIEPMSRVRTRPTRDDTREKLYEAAARVFEEQGIGGASIEAIAAAAGFTRGAFYSNFKSKDELIIAMLEDHVEQSIRRNLDLLARHRNPAEFLDALRTMDRSRQDPLGRSPLLHMEMILFVARAEKRRPELAKRLRARRKLIADIVETTARHSRRNVVLNPAWTGAILLAMEDGFRLHRLIDPETTPADSFLRAIGDLQKAIGISST
jgi:AcrR family transcriptional regulator